MSLRFSLLAGAALAIAPAVSAQSVPQIDAVPTSTVFYDASRVAPVDSIFYDSGDNDVQFTIGFGFPGGSGTPASPDEARATRYVIEVLYTVPADTPEFVLTGAHLRYRTSTVSGATSTPPRVQYDADAPPVINVFRGNQSDPIVADSLDAPTAVFQAELPLTTTTVASTQDGYEVPVPESVFYNFLEDGATTVSNDLRFAAGEEFIIQVQFFNVPFPMQVEAGNDPVNNDRSRAGTIGEQLTEADVLDLLTFSGNFKADVAGADGINDQWFIRAISDDLFFPSAGESAAAAERIALGTPSPNPSAGAVAIPFTVSQSGAARISVYDVTGRQVATLLDRQVGAGAQQVTLDAGRLAAGVYAVVLESNGERVVRTVSVAR